MNQTFEIPQGCTRVTIEQHDNQIITTFEPEVRFKEGDILVKSYRQKDTGADYIFILERIDDGIIYYKAYYCPFFDIIGTRIDCGIGKTGDSLHLAIRTATESEKQQLFDALAKVGKGWNDEKKCIEALKWRAEIGNPYWFLNNYLEPDTVKDVRYLGDNKRYKVGNYFKTEQQAIDFAEIIKVQMKLII